MGRLSFGLLLLSLLLLTSEARAFSLQEPQKTGVGIVLGRSYDPSPTVSFIQLNLMALYDYEQIFAHRAPEALRFKLEANLGLADDSDPRLLASINFFALYYLDRFKTAAFRPYVEGGAGVVYSDFQVKDQGMRINFNPQIGVGAELQVGDGRSCFGAVRAWHLSNSGLHKDNRGINAVTLQLGVHF